METVAAILIGIVAGILAAIPTAGLLAWLSEGSVNEKR